MSYLEIDALTLAEQLTKQNILLIDVRNDHEVAQGVIAGAVHITLSQIPSALKRFAAQETACPIVFYCHSGVRSAHAANFIAPQTAAPVYNLLGGVLAWHRAGLPFAQLKA